MSNKENATNMTQPTQRELKPRLRFPEFQDAGEWSKSFGNGVFEQINNKQHDSTLPVLAITQEHGAIPRNMIDYQVSVTEKSIESYKVVEVGDFIISLRSFQGGIEYSSYKGICSPAYVILRKKTVASENYFKQFFKTERFIQTLNKNIEGLRDGKMVSFKQFSELLIPIPSVDEQQKIADCLSSIDDLITAQTHKLATLKTHKKGLMQHLFPAEGETLPKLRFPEFQDAGEWEEKRMEDVAPLQRGFDLPSDQIIQGSIPVVYSNGIQNFHNKRMAIAPGLVTGRSGTIGKIHFIEEGDYWPHNTSLWVTSFKGNFPKFIYYLYNAIGMNRFASGSGVPTLNRNYVHAFQVCLPPSVGEQQKIANCLSSLDDLITAQTQKLATLKTHKKALMQQLFPAMEEVSS